jgi:hypothetical protein
MPKEKINTYQFGTTVRLECTFYNFDDNKFDPDIVKIKIYDSKYNVILEEEGVKRSQGEYWFDHVTDSKAQTLYYEWYGEIDGKPTIKRGQFMTRFI